ncbi:glycogen/starch synthase [Nitrospira sp. M1]
MRVCLICVEFFGWGKYGGFGRAARTIGRELVKRGVEVFAVVPRREGQQPQEEVDGIHVLSCIPGHHDHYMSNVMLMCTIPVSRPSARIWP